MFSSLFLYSSILLLAKASQPIAPVVDLSDGRYQGYTNATLGLTYFLGMRYAAAPYARYIFIQADSKGHGCSHTYVESVLFVSEFPTPRPRFQGLTTQLNMALLVCSKTNPRTPSAQAHPPLASPAQDQPINPRIVSSSHQIEVGPLTQL